ncbi:unnamed protein product [Periconia digitata]|uniref:Uncharacterized protein n=1 Tax=Periconia digitata TaxID=1303443 RepID=A0A9W4XSR8_9PLEO|nr:unnamed protein product [Periconia digitata]
MASALLQSNSCTSGGFFTWNRSLLGGSFSLSDGDDGVELSVLDSSRARFSSFCSRTRASTGRRRFAKCTVRINSASLSFGPRMFCIFTCCTNGIHCSDLATLLSSVVSRLLVKWNRTSIMYSESTSSSVVFSLVRHGLSQILP